MAIITTGLGVASISGKIGGQVWARNAGGAYVRNQGRVVNPRTDLQTSVRAAFGTSAVSWQGLTEDQRIGWAVYAAGTPVAGRTGPITLSGIAMFQKCNVGRTLIGAAAVLDAPSTLGLSPFNVAGVNFVNNAPSFDINWAGGAGDEWETEVGSAMLVYASPPQKPSINFYKGKFNFVGSVEGAVIPPTSPGTLTFPTGWVWVAGQKVFGRAYVIRADGRISQEAFLTAIAT